VIGPLLEYPPLATLANSFIVAFNNLRHCAPLSVKSTVTLGIMLLIYVYCQYVTLVCSYSGGAYLDGYCTKITQIENFIIQQLQSIGCMLSVE
jgi:hypothetical protein